MRMRTGRTVGVLALALAAACGTSQQRPGGGQARSSRDVITAEEIDASPQATNAYDAIRALRPRFLESRGSTSMRAGESQPEVYVDNVKMGGLGDLRSIPSHTIAEIRYFTASDATQRFGTGHTGGVILVTTKK